MPGVEHHAGLAAGPEDADRLGDRPSPCRACGGGRPTSRRGRTSRPRTARFSASAVRTSASRPSSARRRRTSSTACSVRSTPGRDRARAHEADEVGPEPDADLEQPLAASSGEVGEPVDVGVELVAGPLDLGEELRRALRPSPRARRRRALPPRSPGPAPSDLLPRASWTPVSDSTNGDITAVIANLQLRALPARGRRQRACRGSQSRRRRRRLDRAAARASAGGRADPPGEPGRRACAQRGARPRARRPYALVLDADDRLVPGALAMLRAALEADPSLGFAYGRMRFFGDWDGELRFPPYDPYALLYRHTIGPQRARAARGLPAARAASTRASSSSRTGSTGSTRLPSAGRAGRWTRSPSSTGATEDPSTGSTERSYRDTFRRLRAKHSGSIAASARRGWAHCAAPGTAGSGASGRFRAAWSCGCTGCAGAAKEGAGNRR